MAGYKVTKEIFTDKMNILIYGEAGAGKTHLAGTAQDVPEMQNVHFFNVDGGLMTLASRGDISATDIHSLDDLEQEFFKIANGDDEYKGIKTIVIDNISELQTLALEEEAMKSYKDRVKKNKNYTIDEIYLEDYGVAGKRLARILRGFRDLPLNVIYIAHKKDKMRKGTNVLEASTPNLTDKLCTAVMGYMDIVAYLYTADEQVEQGGQFITVMHRYLLTQPINQFAAKVRNSEFAERLGTVVEDPTFPKIYDAYIGR